MLVLMNKKQLPQVPKFLKLHIGKHYVLPRPMKHPQIIKDKVWLLTGLTYHTSMSNAKAIMIAWLRVNTFAAAKINAHTMKHVLTDANKLVMCAIGIGSVIQDVAMVICAQIGKTAKILQHNGKVANLIGIVLKTNQLFRMSSHVVVEEDVCLKIYVGIWKAYMTTVTKILNASLNIAKITNVKFSPIIHYKIWLMLWCMLW